MAEAKMPPHSRDAEVSLLGSLLIDKDAMVSVADILSPDYFYDPSHQEICRAVLDLYDAREPIDVVTVSERLKKNGKLKGVGGRAYLTTLVNSVPTAAHVAHYSKIVKDLSTRRFLISKATRVVEKAFEETHEIDELLNEAEQAIFGISQKHLKRNFVAIKEVLAESFDRLDELHKTAGSLRGVPTGFRGLDDALAGMQRSNLLILAARPGMGKTSLALNIAKNVAVEHNTPVGFFSLEMSQEELVDRLLVSQADIDAWNLKTGKLDERDFSKLSEAMGVLAEAPLYIDDTPGISVLEMRTKARRLQVEKGLKLLVVDYLQLVRGPKRENRVVEVSEISQMLKNLARELKIPVLALSQLSRAVEARGTKIPVLADLRESGAIEQDADVVMFLYCDDEDNRENMKLSIAKHRNGPLRIIPLRFRGDRISFYSMDTKRSSK